jgi:hypothetical protein
MVINRVKMKVEIAIPYDKDSKSFKFDWEEDFELSTSMNKETLHIKANKEGLIP